jgi:2-dehydropantoate 2-reductase
MSENVLIIGSGALACLFAARLTRSGQPVTMTGSWAAGMSAIRKNGVGLMEAGDVTYYPVPAFELPDSENKFHIAILLTKAYQMEAALQRVKSCLADDGTVLSLQNGLTARARMIEVIGEPRSLSGITTCAAEQLEPGVVRHNGGSSVIIGEHPRLAPYQKILLEAGFSVSANEDIQKLIWEKAIINSAANPVGAILGSTNGEMKALTNAMNLMDELIQEACTVAKAEGIQVLAKDMKKRLRHILEETSGNRCSMLQDVIHGRETEINDINGAIVQFGKKNGIPTPVQNTVTQLVRSIRREVH